MKPNVAAHVARALVPAVSTLFRASDPISKRSVETSLDAADTSVRATSAWPLLFFALTAFAQSPLPNGDGKKAVQHMCDRCHGLGIIVDSKRTKQEWQDVVDDMLTKGATGSRKDVASVVRYLARNYGKTAADPKLAPEPSAPRQIAPAIGSAPVEIDNQTDWPLHGHDAGGTQFSPLKQINPGNVETLTRVWTYRHNETARSFEVTPLVIKGVMYFTTPSARVIALEPETGREIWQYDPHLSRVSATRGVSYWPGDSQNPPRIMLATSDGRLIALDAKTGKPCLAFGDNGQVNLRAGVADDFPKAGYSITSPTAIYKDLAILGPELQEGPSQGPSGDPRAFDIRTGKLVWTFHSLPRPGEFGNDTWSPDGWKNRSGPSAWGSITVDSERGLVFIPTGNPADSFYGADRKGLDLYANSVVALEAATGKLRWYFQMVHHDIFDYDVSAPPALVDVTRNGAKIPAVAEITKSGMLYILDRTTGKPIFGVEERPVPKSDVPGEEAWPTQPFPIKPPPLGRESVTKDELANLSPESHKYCAELLEKYPNHGPFTPYDMKGATVFPGAVGGGNWGGVAFDPGLGYIFMGISNLGSIGRIAPTTPGPARPGFPPSMPYRNAEGYARFLDQDKYPCNQPPWGELIAVDANTGDFAWRTTLGSYDELEAKGIKNTGAPVLGGAIATAGGLVFIAGTNDNRFRAFDSRTGKELWVAKLEATGNATPMTYLGRDGKQYVVIATGGAGHLRSVGPVTSNPDGLVAFALP